MGLKKVYATDENFMHTFKMIKAIAFVPLEEIHAAMNALQKSNLWDPRLDEFVDQYFIVSSTYIS